MTIVTSLRGGQTWMKKLDEFSPTSGPTSKSIVTSSSNYSLIEKLKQWFRLPPPNLPTGQTLNEHIVDLPTACAVNFFGESLAAYRFEIIQSMPETPSDIRTAFDIILPDEQFHRETLQRLSGEEALMKIRPVHELALAALKRT